MTQGGAGTRRAGPSIAVLSAGVAALAIKLFLAHSTRGTNDVEVFSIFLREFQERGAVSLYAADPNFNHPPLLLRLLTGVDGLARWTGLPFAFWLRVPAILADFGSLLVVGRILAARAADPAVRATLFLLALSPTSIFISGFHGNTDPVMVFFLLLSVLWIERPGAAWLAGAAMGMSVSVKVVPLVFWPAVFLWLRGSRARLEYFGAALLVVIAAASPVIFEAPALLARKVLGYPSDYGVFGPSWLLLHLRGALPGTNAFYQRHGRIVLATLLLALSVWMNRGSRRPRLFRQIGVLSFAFLAVAPGFGLQYLAWLVPWVVGVRLAVALLHVVASGAFLALVYTSWCHGLPSTQFDSNWLGAPFWEKGLPWDLANANLFTLWSGGIVPVSILVWSSIVLALGVQLRSIARAGPSEPHPRPDPGVPLP